MVVNRQKIGSWAAVALLSMLISFVVEAQETDAADPKEQPAAPAPSEPVPTPKSEPRKEPAPDAEQKVELEHELDSDEEDTDFIDAIVERVQLHGFVSQGFMISTDNNYVANSDSGTFEFTEIGVNISAQVTDSLRTGIQLLSYDLGEDGNYDIVLDWAVLEFRPFNWLGLRAGRIKNPHALYGETWDVDAARVPILLPQSLYAPENRYLFNAFPGLVLFGNIPIDPLGSIEYKGYGGTFNSLVLEDEGEIRGKYVVGGQIIWETPLPGLRVGGDLVRGVFSVVVDTSQSPTLPAASFVTTFPTWRWAAFIEFNAYDILLAAEYLRFAGQAEPREGDLFGVPSFYTEGFYFMGAYSFTEWFHVGSYYSLQFADVGDRRGEGERFWIDHNAWQKDLAFTLRFDIKEFWLIKLEGHYMDGTSALIPMGIASESDADLVERWGLFLIKTTLSF